MTTSLDPLWTSEAYRYEIVFSARNRKAKPTTIKKWALLQVRVRRRIGEGGFAFVYAVEQSDDGRPMALKRLLAADAEKRKQTVQEITFLKKLKPCPRGVTE